MEETQDKDIYQMLAHQPAFQPLHNNSGLPVLFHTYTEAWKNLSGFCLSKVAFWQAVGT